MAFRLILSFTTVVLLVRAEEHNVHDGIKELEVPERSSAADEQSGSVVTDGDLQEPDGFNEHDSSVVKSTDVESTGGLEVSDHSAVVGSDLRGLGSLEPGSSVLGGDLMHGLEHGDLRRPDGIERGESIAVDGDLSEPRVPSHGDSTVVAGYPTELRGVGRGSSVAVGGAHRSHSRGLSSYKTISSGYRGFALRGQSGAFGINTGPPRYVGSRKHVAIIPGRVIVVGHANPALLNQKGPKSYGGYGSYGRPRPYGGYNYYRLPSYTGSYTTGRKVVYPSYKIPYRGHYSYGGRYNYGSLHGIRYSYGNRYGHGGGGHGYGRYGYGGRYGK
ncbi:shematrin-like protein 2 [Macrobrachium nipponense]|uniref:shematrin-like protein 2 n=1 Tax=Macrobrachium nipponense TaxID=159736 RepID=UPI0030C7E3B7